MYIECVAIIVVIAIVLFMAARSGRTSFAWVSSPLLIVPAAYLLSLPVSHLLDRLLPSISQPPLAIGVTLVGLVAACVLYGMLCGNFPTPRARRTYLIACSGFSFLLAAVLITNLIHAAYL
ncbi:MAG: hypothetical protein HFG26_11890 [Provencibacterium sp.]|jgi:hypothetical protein|nr:hypothetical protein [Provencibacterium sp.]